MKYVLNLHQSTLTLRPTVSADLHVRSCKLQKLILSLCIIFKENWFWLFPRVPPISIRSSWKKTDSQDKYSCRTICFAKLHNTQACMLCSSYFLLTHNLLHSYFNVSKHFLKNMINPLNPNGNYIYHSLL
jgi:hypothetical protein